MIFDTHAHYDDKKFDADRKEVLSAMPASGVSLILDPGCDGGSSRAACALAKEFPFVYAAVGWHPEEWQSWNGESMALLRSLCAQPKVVAIGEIGLDYYWDTEHKALQREMFERQLSLAIERGLPVIVHDREAHGDCLETVMNYPEARGVFHCFSGSVEMARELLRRGWYLGFDGPITYKNAVKALDVIAACPADRMLLETDSPYLAPVPNRGRRNDSRNLPYIAARIAEIKGMTTEQVAEVTLQNGKQLFNLCALAAARRAERA